MKKSSDTQRQLEFPIFFLDRNLGREKLPTLLRSKGFMLQVHDEHFQQDEADDVWLSKCGERCWVVITPDTHILRERVNMRAIGRSKGRVFFLSSNNLRAEIWAEALTAAWRDINSAIRNRDGPFIARISSTGQVWGIKELTKHGREKRKSKRPKVREEWW